MSTFTDIEMRDANGERFRIDLPFEFKAWNKSAVRNCQLDNAEYPWDSIALEIEEMIKSRDSLKEGLTDAR